MAVDYFTKRYLAAAVDMTVQCRPHNFLRDTFFKNSVFPQTESIDIETNVGKRKVAAYVLPKDEAGVVVRQGYTAKSYKLPYIKEKMVTNAADILKKGFGESIYGGKTPEQLIQDQLARDLAYLDDRITRAEEVQASQALFSGQVTVNNGDTLAFGLDSTHNLTLLTTDKFSDASQTGDTILSTLRGYRRLLIKDSGRAPDIMVCSIEVIDVLIKKLKASGSQAMISDIKLDRGQIDPRNLADGVTYWGYIKELGVDLYTYDEVYLDAADAEQRMVPANKFFLGSTKARMDINHGLIQDLDALYSVERYAKSWTQDDPSARFLMMQSAPLLVPTEIWSYMVVTAL